MESEGCLVGLKSFLVKKFIDFDLIPCRTRWRKSITSIGRIHIDIHRALRERYGSEGAQVLDQVMYRIGQRQANEILGALGLERDLEGCGYAVMVMHRIFGIKSRIVRKDAGSITMQVTHCRWGRRTEGWGPALCVSIGRYEDGLIETILPDSVHAYDKRYTLGDRVCELTIRLPNRSPHPET